jgi:hypothetical protein
VASRENAADMVIIPPKLAGRAQPAHVTPLYSRCYCLPTNSVHFARLFLPASSRSVPYHPQERLLVGCWCLLIPFPFTPATGPALGPRRKIEIQPLTRRSPIPSNGEMCPTVIDKNRPIESIGSRFRGSGVRARFNSHKIHLLDLCTPSFPVGFSGSMVRVTLPVGMGGGANNSPLPTPRTTIKARGLLRGEVYVHLKACYSPQRSHYHSLGCCKAHSSTDCNSGTCRFAPIYSILFHSPNPSHPRRICPP